MATRMSKKLRFEVLKRDKFTCRYCGAKAPDAVLHVDHIKPWSDGGTSNMMNLVTACADCNLGKKARPLGDLSVSVANREQLEQAQDRAEQLRQMAEWQAGLANLDDERHKLINQVLSARFQFTITGPGLMAKVDRAIKKADMERFIKAADGALDWIAIQDRTPDAEAIVERILRMMKYGDRHTDPKAAAAYVVGIMRNRFNLGWGKLNAIGSITERAMTLGMPFQDLYDTATTAEHWSHYVSGCDGWIFGCEEPDSRPKKPSTPPVLAET